MVGWWISCCFTSIPQASASIGTFLTLPTWPSLPGSSGCCSKPSSARVPQKRPDPGHNDLRGDGEFRRHLKGIPRRSRKAKGLRRAAAPAAVALALALAWSAGSARAEDDEEDVPLDSKLFRQ